jgi:hypothetical protein
MLLAHANEVITPKVSCNLRLCRATLARIHRALLRPDIQVHRTNQLEERIILRLRFTFLEPLIPPDEMDKEDLDFLQREIEADAHPLPKRKWNILRFAALLHTFRVPPADVELVRVLPVLRIAMEMVKRNNDDIALFHFQSARQNQILLCCTSGLV